MSKREVEQLLKSRGFVFGVYPEGVLCWELVVKEDDELKNKICAAFEMNIETEIESAQKEVTEYKNQRENLIKDYKKDSVSLININVKNLFKRK